ncbi:MAG: hypothetical protein E6J62_12555 [Deltaproteobacteria bacterium]|nr:MAG: hypothetical protein E6J62_12555 [Deltaproteobacteria bacterium]
MPSVPSSCTLRERQPGGGIDIDTVEGQHHLEPPLGGSIEQAGGIGQGGPEPIRVAARDRGRIAIEAVQVRHPEPLVPGGVEYVHHVVDRLQDEAVPGAEALVGRLDRELVAVVREPLLAEVEAVEGDVDLGIRLGLLARAGGGGTADVARQCAVDEAVAFRAGGGVSIVDAEVVDLRHLDGVVAERRRPEDAGAVGADLPGGLRAGGKGRAEEG